ncbi:MAG TPA: UDP-N-acetylmuramyl-tripeptide synthetase [Candidatus Angelobacter sp.]|nr:UDP-N-acetylmuramyl-tripeptide synthetase [Candidatus Angelobacter sp.]
MANIRKIVKKLIPTKLFRKVEPFGHLIESVVANVRYGFPSRGFHVIGVTGTNGKTTTTFLIHKMLQKAGFKVGMLSTVAYGIGDDIKSQMEHITTAQAGILQKRLSDFKRAGVEWLVLETSSHSLSQYRTWGVPYEIAVMTNITKDHLDYHGVFDSYLEAKRRLFTIAAKHGRKFGVVNADDPNAKEFIDSTPRSITYGVKNGELRASNIKLAADHSTFQANVGADRYDIRINIPGDFNVSNSLAAVAVGRELSLTKGQIEQGIAALKGVEGRMTVIDEGQKFKVIVDFASTPDAFTMSLGNLRPVTKGKLISVFGSAGRRDEAKRAIQGEIAGRFSDEVILTEEDDRDIDGNQILAQIAEGATRAGKVKDKDMFLILDRESAIKFALGRVKTADDTVVLLGKGHEKTIERADGEHPWNEIEITKKLIKG